VRIGFLGTRVGRRFLVVNLLTALIPVAVITAVSFVFVRAELRDQTAARIGQLSKSTVLTTLSGLGAISLVLAEVRDTVALNASFEGFGQADAAKHEAIAGGRIAPFTPDQLEQLRSGRPLIVLAPASQTTGIIIVRASGPWTVTRMPVLWGVARGPALFTDVDDALLGEGADVCIYETQALRRIHCSDAVTPAVERIAMTSAREGGRNPGAAQEGNMIVSAREVYLRHAYGAQEWTAVVMRPVDATFAGAANFRNTFVVLMGAVIVLIFILSHAQIRRTTEPLERLEEGTRRLQAGDFGTPVAITGDDEFAHVAQSFNGMASSLHRQISLMKRLDAVDQSALGARDAVAVMAEALRSIASTVPCERVSLAVSHPTDPAAMQIGIHEVGSGVRRDATRMVSSAEREELLRSPRHLLLQGTDIGRSYRAQGTTPAAVVLPLVTDGVLLGVICMDVPLHVATDAGSWTEARRIADRVTLALSNVQLLSRLDALSTGTVLAFARAIDANSPWTAGHSERVTRIAIEIGREMQLSASALDTLERGGLLHDIGKIAVPPAVLDKAGRLTEEEWAVMRRHPVVGCEILSPIPAFADALPLVRSHHERMDGTGYPDQLYGEAIPLLARVLAVADVFDALASDRPYRPGMTTEAACDIIQRGSGSHFDPSVVHAFMDAVHAGRIKALTAAGDSADLAASVARAREPVAHSA
jgi:HD-GYP domain-containing protein (c-di-GMP phosphodiesterase class II)/HAMP domain-containing protein